MRSCPNEQDAVDVAPLISVGKQWYLVVALMLIAVIAYIDRQCLALLAPMIKLDLHLSDTRLSLLLGASFALFNAVVAIPAGWMVDRFNRKAILAVGTLLWSVMNVLGGLAGNFVQLFCARAGVGFAEGALAPTAFSLIRASVEPKRRGRAFSIFGLAQSTGQGGAAVLVGLMIAFIGERTLRLPLLGELRPWQIVLIVIGTCSMPFALLVLPIREPPRTLSREPFMQSYRQALRYLIAHRQIYVPITLYAGFISMMSGAMIGWLPSIAARNYGLSIAVIGPRLGGIPIIVMPLGTIVAGLIIDYFRSRGVKAAAAWVGLGGLLLTIVPTTLTALMPSANSFWICFTCSTATLACLYQVANNVLASITPKEAAGKLIAVYTLIFTAMAALGPLIVGLLSDRVFQQAGKSSLALAEATGVGSYLLLAIVCILIALRNLRAYNPSTESPS